MGGAFGDIMKTFLIPLFCCLLCFFGGLSFGKKQGQKSASNEVSAAQTQTSQPVSTPVRQRRDIIKMEEEVQPIEPRITGHNPQLDTLVSSLMQAVPPNELDSYLATAQEDLFYALFRAVSMDQPQLAVELALQLPDGAMRNIALPDALSEWSERSPFEAFDCLKALTSNDYQQAFANVFAHLADQHPEFAARQIDAISDPNIRLDAIHRAATEWMQVDATSVFKWAEGFANPKEYEVAVLASLGEYARVQPLNAYEYIQQLDNPKYQKQLARRVGASMGDGDLLQGLKWARTADSAVQASILEGMSSEIDVAFADGGFYRAFQNVPAAEAMQMVDVIEPFLERSYPQAAEAMVNLPPERIPFFAERFLPAIYAENPEQTKAWVEALPDGTAKNLILDELVRLMSPRV